MARSQSFSLGSDNVLEAVKPYGCPKSAFPRNLDVDDAKWRRSETLHQWFKRLVDKLCKRRPEVLALEDNIAILAMLSWDNQRIIYASVPILVVPGCTLTEYYNGKAKSDGIYLRLDVSYNPLGEVFSHPLAHIHIGNGNTPRFALPGGANGNVLMDFLEFVYLNFAYEKWQDWATQKWTTRYPLRANEFHQIAQNFTDSDLHALQSKANIISEIKDTLRKAKDERFDFHAELADIKLMKYP